MLSAENAQHLFDGWFGRRRSMVILRGLSTSDTVREAARAIDAGLALVEVPLQSDESERALTAAVQDGNIRGAAIGAGTITSVDLVERAAAAGARFTVAPGFDADVLERSLSLGMPHLPGVATATEIHTARRFGLRWLKAFPATALTPQWFSAMLGPYPEARFVATGGVDRDNFRQFMAAGCSAVSFGSSFVDIETDTLAELP